MNITDAMLTELLKDFDFIDLSMRPIESERSGIIYETRIILERNKK